MCNKTLDAKVTFLLCIVNLFNLIIFKPDHPCPNRDQYRPYAKQFTCSLFATILAPKCPLIEQISVFARLWIIKAMPPIKLVLIVLLWKCCRVTKGNPSIVCSVNCN